MSLYVRYQPVSISGGGGGGSVTSVGLADGSTSPIYTISGSPVTTSGTLTFTLATKAANLVFAGPTTGAAAQPGFRALVTADLPAGTGTVTSVSVVSANGFAGSVATATTTPAITLTTSINSPVLAGNGTAIIAATLGNLTDAGTDGITIGSGTGAVIGSGTTISQHVADTTHNGYLSSTDWNTFNNKQAAGSYITALTGDVTATGPGSVAATVAKIQGTTVSGTTGSTNVVFSTSPTMSNPVVGTQSQGDGSTKAASTSYVDVAVANAIAGVNPAVAVQAATTAASDTSGFTYNNGVAGIGATFTGTANTAVTIDGYTFTALGQRLLVKNDTQSPSGAFNGIYYVTQVQALGLPPIFTRALDYDMPSDINNTGAIPVINGTVNTTTSWVNTALIVTVGTTPFVFVEFTRNPADYLLKANNLSDVASTTTAFNNISPMTTTGDIIYGGASGTRTRLGIGSTGNVLTVAGGIPSWAAPATSGTVTSVAMTVPAFLSIAGSPITSSGTLAVSLSGTALPLANGGTGQTTKAAAFDALSPMTTGGDLIYGGASGTGTRLANGSSGQVLTSAGTTLAPTWATPTTGTVTSVAMTVPASSLFSVAGSPITSSGTLAVTTAGTSGGVAYFSSTTQMNSSGLLATNGLVLGGGAGAAPTTLTTSSSTTAALISGGTNTAPSWGTLAIGGGGTGQTSKAAAFDALQPMTTGGDIIYGGASGTGTRLANGTAGTVLTSAGTTLAPTWSAVSVTSVAAGYQSSAAQSITSTAAVVKFATSLYDTNSAYSGSTGNFTAPSAGKYLITGYIQSQAVSSSSTGFFLMAYKNGSLYARIGGEVIIASGSNVYTASGSAIIDLALNDTIALWALSDTTVSLSATATNNSIFIQKLGN